MWTTNKPDPVKLVIGILAANQDCLNAAIDAVVQEFGESDLASDVWDFHHTKYYNHETGEHILRQFVTIDKLIDPGQLAAVKHKTNEIEQRLAQQLETDLPRPVNLDPGYIEPSKLILATTKNFSHRIYIGNDMYAEVTLMYDKGQWQTFPYTYKDYREKEYHQFFSTVRKRILEQLRF